MVGEGGDTTQVVSGGGDTTQVVGGGGDTTQVVGGGNRQFCYQHLCDSHCINYLLRRLESLNV